jgi:general secretion pathway protein O
MENTTILYFIYGLTIGSFSNVLITRLPIMIQNQKKLEYNLINPPSQCMECKEDIEWKDLIPVLSWMVLRGKCRKCKAKISYKYPLIELIHGIIWGLMSEYHLGIEIIIWSIFISTCLNLAYIDAKHMLLPNVLTYFLIFSGLLVSIVHPQIVGMKESILGGLSGFTLFYILDLAYKKMKNKIALGGGDIKYICGIGVWFGVLNLPTILLIASISAIGATLIKMALTRKSMGTISEQQIPFGVYITASAIIMYLINYHTATYIIF